MSVLGKRQPVLPEGTEPKTGRMLIKAERVIHSLGEDGVKPLPAAEFKKVRVSAGYGTPEMKASALKPVVLGNRVLNWIDVEKIEIAHIKEMVPKEETVVVFHLDAIANMGAKEIDYETMRQASWDYACMEKIDSEEMRDRYLATRLKSFDGYLSRKVYATALGLMEFRQ